MSDYRPRSAPARFFEGAPEIVKAKIAVIHGPFKETVCEYDALFKETTGGTRSEVIGLDFGRYGAQGCHFFLAPHECRAYRERCRRNRIAWADLPEATQKAIVNYLQAD